MVHAAVSKNWGVIYKIFEPKFRMKGHHYKRLLTHHLMPAYFRKTPRRFHSKFWHQEDGAGPHHVRATSNYLHGKLGGRVLARDFRTWQGVGFNWPAKSPDLSMLDYYFNNAIKRLVFSQGNLQNIESLKAKIHEAFASIDQEEIKRQV